MGGHTPLKKMTEEIDLQESSTPEEETVDETVVEEETSDDTPTLEDYHKLSETKKQISARLAKAEAELKKLKTQPKTNQTNTSTALSREEAILFAKGLTEEEVDLAAKIATINGTTLVKATEDPYFQSKIEEREQKQRSLKAQLGASGGGHISKGKDISNMSTDEHRELYMKAISQM